MLLLLTALVLIVVARVELLAWQRRREHRAQIVYMQAVDGCLQALVDTDRVLMDALTAKEAPRTPQTIAWIASASTRTH
jgi:hypothetical protein